MSATLPVITYPPELPVSQRREELARAIRENQVVIIAGETGSGKTTQLPKICLELGREHIGHTQPRRIAARTIAERIAEELGEEVGETVGYQVRFTDRSSADTRVKVMTDGILLAELARDRRLSRYDTIIIDEAHERSLTIDVLLGHLKRLLPERPDLKLIITSATIDPESFSQHFGGAPVEIVSGRTYPVDIRYRPMVDEVAEDGAGDATAEPIDLPRAVGDAVAELANEEPGDVLVFLSGENEIRDVGEVLGGRFGSSTEILPLYGRLSAADQHRVFDRGRAAGIRRRVVLATNVAETSLTVPGIRYVVDAGTARISRYSTRSKVQMLPIEAISQASANQRSGRAGRTSPGIAIRLYAEDDFGRRPEFMEPEILRTNLAAVILQLTSLGMGDIENFPFLTPPDSRGIRDGILLLRELGALREEGAGGEGSGLTRVGRDLARLPIDPRYGRMIIESRRHDTTREVLAIVAGLTVQDVRERPLERRGTADQAHARFTDPTSDFLGLLNLWNYLEQKQDELSGSAFRRLCKAEFLNYLRVREWQDLYRQLARNAKPLKLTIAEPRVDPDGIHKSLLSGLLSHLGLRDEARAKPGQGEYLGARQTRFTIFPGSALAKRKPAAVMSAELVETARLFARVNAAIDPAWAEPIAGDLVKRSHGEPHWEAKQGAAVAYERVTLYGLPIVPRRRILWSRIDPAHARELFLRHALVDDEWESTQKFQNRNRAVRDRVRAIEERERRRDLLDDGDAVYRFYDARIPAEVASAHDFDVWWRRARAERPELLDLREEDLLPQGAELDDEAYPTDWTQGDRSYRLDYRFDPGAENDGLTVRVPLALLPGLTADGFDWHVPGMRRELVTALIKTLPKAIRRTVVPATDWAERLVATLPDEPPQIEGRTQRLTEAIAAAITREAANALSGRKVQASDFELDKLPAHLRPTFRVVDERGRTLGEDKDTDALRAALGERGSRQVAKTVASAAGPSGSALERSGLSTWDLDALPAHVETRHGPSTVRAYPALVDEGATAGIRLYGTPAEAAAAHTLGLTRLLLLAVPSPAAYVREHLTQNEKLALTASPYRSVNALFDDAVATIAADALRGVADGDPSRVRDRAAFERARDAFSAAILPTLDATIGTVLKTLAAQRTAEKAISSANSMALLGPLSDARDQLTALVFDGFVGRTGLERLPRLPVYVEGVSVRIARLAENPGRDRAGMLELQTARERFEGAGGSIPLPPGARPGLVRARWLLEELRISLFAQSLRTAEPVSVQRIVKALAD